MFEFCSFCESLYVTSFCVIVPFSFVAVPPWYIGAGTAIIGDWGSVRPSSRGGSDWGEISVPNCMLSDSASLSDSELELELEFSRCFFKCLSASSGELALFFRDSTLSFHETPGFVLS